MAQIVQRAQRFTPEEWKMANRIKHKTAERDRVGAERLILESKRLDNETREQSDTTLDDANKKIGKHILFDFISTQKYYTNLSFFRSTIKGRQVLEARARG